MTSRDEVAVVSRETIAGMDEAGRGPLAGPVVAGIVILDSTNFIAGLADSKTLTARRRTELAEQIRSNAVAWGIGQASVAEIDELNILRATMLAMERAFYSLNLDVEQVYIDGNKVPNLPCKAIAVIGGDRIVPAISAASILAKVTRDEIMSRAAEKYPEYGFEQHKGYPTKQHLHALRECGPCEIHRRTFAPVQRVIVEMDP